jgi:hypothetical protein
VTAPSIATVAITRFVAAQNPQPQEECLVEQTILD